MLWIVLQFIAFALCVFIAFVARDFSYHVANFYAMLAALSFTIGCLMISYEIESKPRKVQPSVTLGKDLKKISKLPRQRPKKPAKPPKKIASTLSPFKRKPK